MGIRTELTNDFHKFAEKITSARFIISVMIIGTLCWVVVRTTDLLRLGLEDKEKFMAVKEVFVYTMGIVSGIAGSIVTLYFNRSDRKKDTEDTESKV
jgi:hypothetical protein